MAPIVPTSSTDSLSTRPRLQALNQDFSDLDEQIRQAAHIIGLPDDWSNINEQEKRTEVIRHIVRARAEWVLRWVLDKLKDETDTGKKARAHPATWQLLDWMIHVLPVSHSAPHLRDASLPTILERALFEHFDSISNAQSEDVNMEDASGSSDSSQTTSKPSRKRKRGANGTTSKQVASNKTSLNTLFQAIRAVAATVIFLASRNDKTHDSTQAELMKMTLRTESAQAARILRFWLEGVTQLLSSKSTNPSDLNDALDLSLVVEIWDLRNIDSKDEVGVSADEYSMECLAPTLGLLETLGSLRKQILTQISSVTIDRAMQTLDRLLAKHLLAPSRAAFFADASEEPAKPASEREATALSSNLEPLRAELLRAAQIEDAGDSLPAKLALLFNAVPTLLDLTIRASPSRSPKGKLAEKPWIQAAFTALSACAGCSLHVPPQHILHKTAVGALDGALRVLQVQNVSISPKLVETVFWYYGGVKYPERQENQIQWPLIASLINLDASVFVAEPKTDIKESPQSTHADLAEFIFERISVEEKKNPDFSTVPPKSHVKVQQSGESTSRGKTLVMETIIVPLMSAFVRNRNLLGFLRRWDQQIVRSYRHVSQKTPRTHRDQIWEDRALGKALGEIFEQSLTQGQISTLVEEHARRIAKLGETIENGANEDIRKLADYGNAASSAFIVPAILQAIRSDETVLALTPHLDSLFRSLTTWVQDDRFSLYSQVSQSWFTLSQLLAKLWPIELHKSPSLQGDLLEPLIPSALNDISGTRTGGSKRCIDSSAQAASMLFLLNVCTYMQTVPDFEAVIQATLTRITKALSSKQLDLSEQAKVVEFFCTYFVGLFGYLEGSECEELLQSVLSILAEVEDGVQSNLLNSVSHSIINEGNASLKKGYYATLAKALSESDGPLHNMAVKAMSYIHPAAFSREQREAILNQTIELICAKSSTSTELISIATHIMETPNATAKISTDSGVIFAVAEKLYQHGNESPATLQLLRQLVQSILGHMIPNENQSQNKKFLKGFAEKVDQIATASKKCSAARLSILRATIHAQKQSKLLDPLQYVELLKHCLTDGDGAETASLEEILDAFNELPSATLQALNIYDTTRAWLRIWVNDNADLESYTASSGGSSPELAEYVARLHTTVAKFRLYPTVNWFISLTLRLLREPLNDGVKATTYDAVKDALAPLPFWEKLDLIPTLTEAPDSLDHASSYRIFSIMITTLSDKLESNAELKQKQLALLPRICALLSQTADYAAFNALLNSINTILNDKPSLASQHSIECVLSALVKLTSRSSPALPPSYAPDIFSRLCETTRLILLLHRGRIGGRFHILLPLLQGLLFCLFIPNTPRSGALPTWLRPTASTSTSTLQIHLTPQNATQFSRILSTLCNPPQSSITKAHQHHHSSSKNKDLNDPVKAARERTGAFLYPLLAAFCRFQLGGRLEAGVREKVMPGVWEAVGTAAVHKEGLDAMFAGLGRSEKDVWRGVWGEWESVHGRRGLVD
ncbi:hypothetical protein T440DRAFT_507365 [Plenodomus tracheiphilus IPT5]|uniref:Nucleolar 27S pre-rRNA processing Urb2/Npa2 C-terminal domain-containing protein n=1 Tax=Plenodomus tracheiphilus IPT5 TaxID=1408161 RepID=A0A6A7B9U9_9PLEO|nr:hypothetical protein T440DRAFT_507365 [Plenodomus tracheiphilus IPT5]